MFFKSILRKLPLLAAAATVSTLPLMCKDKHEVFMWGNGVYQARPDALLQFQNFTPKKITNLPDCLVHLQLGEYYEAGIDDSGNLYVWRTQKVDANIEEQGRKDSERQEVQLLAKGIKEVKFTTGYIWTLNEKNEVIQYPIVKEFQDGKTVSNVKLGKPRSVDPLKGSVQICAGNDHLIALSKKGEVYAMGDDTYGQCGLDIDKRSTFPPFNERRVSYPVRVQHLKNVKKIAAGGNHCLALDQSGSLYGWGSNSNMQLSHEEEFSQMNSPLICSFTPVRISKSLDNSEIIDIKAGGEFSVIISKNKLSESYEVHTFGSNLKGELGIGQIKHVRDITKVEALSNFILKRKGKEQKVTVNQIGCGSRHCIVLLNIGYVMEWGDNEHGQMGNKKRSTVYTPIIIRQFSEKNIVGVFAGENQSGVILKVPEQNDKSKSQEKTKK